MFKFLGCCTPSVAVEEADEFVSMRSNEVDITMGRWARKRIVNGGQPLQTIGESWLCQKLSVANLEKIGRGSFGVVYSATDANHKMFAVKTQMAPIDTVGDLLITYDEWRNEVSVLEEVRGHPNFVQIEKVIYLRHCAVVQKVPTHMAIMMEYLPMSVADILKVKPQVYEREEQLRAFLVDMMEGVSYLHSKQIIHHDIKPLNTMAMVSFELDDLCTTSLDILQDQMKSAKYKIIDFGLAEKLSNGGANCRGGTPAYIAPEKNTQPHHDYNGYLADAYSVGISAVELASPWSFSRYRVLNKDVIIFLNNARSFGFLDHITGTPVLDVIFGLVKKDPKERMSIAQALDLLKK